LKNEQLTVLRTMNEATNRMDLNMFAQKINLTPNQTITQIQELAKTGFLRKSESGGFGITAKGKAALKAFTSVPQEKGFHFYIGMDTPAGLTAQSLSEFYALLEQVSADSLVFHLRRGDFEKWAKDVLEEEKLAQELGNLESAGLSGEELRKELLGLIEAEYGVRELL
jgi:predicted transcriptional regulator